MSERERFGVPSSIALALHDPENQPSQYGTVPLSWSVAHDLSDDESEAVRMEMARLLDGIANALRGEPPPRTRWSWHDLPDRAAAAIASIDVFVRAAAELARSGQAASGSSQGARSDEAVKRFGIKPWSTLAQLKDDEDLELYVQARIEAEGVGQPEAPTAAALPKGWDVIRKDDPLKTIIVIAPNGYSAVTTAVSRNPENVLRMLVEAIAAHPPARSGAGSEEAPNHFRDATEMVPPSEEGQG